MELPEAQVAVLEALDATDATPVEQLADELDRKPETVTGAVFELAEAGLVEVVEREGTDLELTDEGREYVETGLPENRLHEAALRLGADDGPVPMGEAVDAAGLDGERVRIAISNYVRKGYGEVEAGELTAAAGVDASDDEEAATLAALAAGDGTESDGAVVERLVERNLIERRERTARSVRPTDAGVTALMEGVETAGDVGQVTPELLTSGEWRDAEFAPYNVEADASPVEGGRLHPLRAMAERVKEVLVGMGFREMQGPHADSEFWINDCLFMPQDHPARTHWDQFVLDVPPMADLPDDPVADVERAHREGSGEDGDGYHSPWTEDVARRVGLRGHTTSLSARYLSGLEIGELEPPQRFFSVEKAYRNDEIDATHLLEFFQIEGWVMAEDLSVRDLMGTFREFYEQFGITDLEFKPTYNPYTEPSFELFGTHPTTGEVVEIGNSGLFRPEMLDPLGVDCDVMAWGLALERLMMLVTGAEDIRDVHGTLVDLEYLRGEEVTY
jgi:phenylalanyl-tRNA synthetase alpha chain